MCETENSYGRKMGIYNNVIILLTLIHTEVYEHGTSLIPMLFPLTGCLLLKAILRVITWR